MAKEIEVKYLVDPNLDPSTLKVQHSALIRQGYTVDGVRFRHSQRIGDDVHHYYICHKTGNGAIKEENECTISQAVFESVWPLTEGRRVRKIRHYIPHDKLIIELDEYIVASKLPLKTAEIEFPSEKDMEKFLSSGNLPSYFGESLVGVKGYSNRALAI